MHTSNDASIKLLKHYLIEKGIINILILNFVYLEFKHKL